MHRCRNSGNNITHNMNCYSIITTPFFLCVLNFALLSDFGESHLKIKLHKKGLCHEFEGLRHEFGGYFVEWESIRCRGCVLFSPVKSR